VLYLSWCLLDGDTPLQLPCGHGGDGQSSSSASGATIDWPGLRVGLCWQQVERSKASASIAVRLRRRSGRASTGRGIEGGKTGTCGNTRTPSAANATQGVKTTIPDENMPTIRLVGMRPSLEPHCWRGLFCLGLKHNKEGAKLNYIGPKNTPSCRRCSNITYYLYLRFKCRFYNTYVLLHVNN
jgi:hypothetical protein